MQWDTKTQKSDIDNISRSPSMHARVSMTSRLARHPAPLTGMKERGRREERSQSPSRIPRLPDRLPELTPRPALAAALPLQVRPADVSPKALSRKGALDGPDVCGVARLAANGVLGHLKALQGSHERFDAARALGGDFSVGEAALQMPRRTHNLTALLEHRSSPCNNQRRSGMMC